MVSRNTFVRAMLLSIAFLLIITGLYDGEARMVFMKAANICLECIGIG